MNRTQAYFEHRKPLRNFCNSQYCKRACLHCLMKGDMLVLDSEWHWIFDYPHFEDLLHKVPVLKRTIQDCYPFDDPRRFAEVANLVSLLKEVQIQYRVAVSLGSFIGQAKVVRESWIREAFSRCRPCFPPEHWKRNVFLHPPSDADFPAEVAENFHYGQPLFEFFDDISDA